MMSFLISLLVACLSISEAKLRRFDENHGLTSKDAGAYHTEAFEIMAELFEERTPRDKMDVIADVANVLSLYCPKNDPTFIPHKVALETFYTVKNKTGDINCPHDFDPSLKKMIDKTFSTVKAVNELNLEEKIADLIGIEKEIEAMEVDNTVYQNMTLGTLSTAIESTKLWHSVFYDPNHKLHNIFTKGRRRLQFYDFGFIVHADIRGFIEGGLEELMNNATLFFLPIELTGKAIMKSISASAGWVVDEVIDPYPFPGQDR